MKHHSDKILLFDNNLDRSNYLNDLTLNLTKRGHHTEKSQYGQRASEMARQIEPNLILFDFVTSLADNHQAFYSLKESKMTDKIPIMFFGDSHEKKHKVKAIEMGGVDYITKPFYLEEAIARIERQLEIQQLQQKLRQQNIILQKEITLRTKVETALRQANQELKCLATTDGLTGVSNRRRFDRYIDREWRRLAREKGNLSLIMVDVDCFKQYNDSNGHQAGDNCLEQIAGAISRTVKRPGDLVTRYGGEEFAVILPQTDLPGAIHIAHKIQVAVRYLNIPHRSSPVKNLVTISQGVSSTIPGVNTNPESLICLADLALYDAKDRGRNRVASYVL